MNMKTTFGNTGQILDKAQVDFVRKALRLDLEVDYTRLFKGEECPSVKVDSLSDFPHDDFYWRKTPNGYRIYCPK
jgi:hypothetical protein